MARRRVAVLFGGASSEYEVSLRSARFVMANLEGERYEVVPVGITKTGQWLLYEGPFDLVADDKWNDPEYVSPVFLPAQPGYGGLIAVKNGQPQIVAVDVFFPVLHGKNGEDGTVQGLFELAKMPFVGCGVLSSAVCMDKCFTHMVLDRHGIPTAKWAQVLPGDMENFGALVKKLEENLGYPMFIKPANAGSSVGVSKVLKESELSRALERAFCEDKKALAEEYVPGKEIECAVFGRHGRAAASVPGEIEPKKSFYDYEAKYQDDSTNLYIPARLADDVAEKVRKTALQAFDALGCEGLARVDFFVDGGKITLNEVNTMPGFTEISMYPKLMMQSMSAGELVCGLVDLALERAGK